MNKSDRRNLRNLTNKLKISSRLALVAIFAGFSGDKPFNLDTQRVLAQAQSQIVPDSTLSGESSTVTPDRDINSLPSELIEGGAQRGDNLFHSFSQFNVESGRGAYFANPDGIANIFSRVTGADASEIMGTLGVLGNADLFLINPNGIIFGENASLDLNGSFVGTTADAIQFGEQGFFNATEPNAAPLLTVQPSSFLFNQMNPGRIESRAAIAPAGSNILNQDLFGLRVADGESLILLGGEIAIDGSRLHALNGSVELLAAASGQIELDTNENNLTLIPADQLQLADISISNESYIDTSNEGGGAIFLQGKNISITEESLVSANALGQGNSGNINIDTSETIAIDRGRISSQITSNAKNGGDINLTANSLSLINDGLISTSTFGEGDGGNINIDTSETIAIDRGRIFSNITSDATGNGGEINLTANSLSLINDGLISTSTFGEGNSGNINIDTSETIAIESSQILSQITSNAIGNGRDINLTANSLSIVGDSVVSTSTFGEGNSGNINIDTSETIAIDRSQIFSNISDDATGNGGNINLIADSLFLTGESTRISANILGQGDSGNININTAETISIDFGDITSEILPNAIGNGGDINLTTNSLSLTNDGLISTNTFGQGDSGNINIDTSETIAIDTSRILSNINSNAIGNGGDINLQADSLSLRDGVISISNSGQGDSGNLDIDTTKTIAIKSSQILSNINSNAIGNGGNVNLQTDLLSLRDSVVSTSTDGQGDGGNINIDTAETIAIESSQISSNINSNAIGSGGDINLTADSLSVTGESTRISANILGEGDSGNININTAETTSIDFGDITSEIIPNAVGNGGDINLTANSLFLTNDGLISTNTFGEGDSGNINIDTTETIFIEDRGRILSRTGGTAIGDGGDINLAAESLSITDDFPTRPEDSARISTNTAGQGDGGNINIDAAEAISIDFGDVTSEVFPNATGNEGDINLTADSLFLTNDGLISTSTFRQGDRQSIDIAPDSFPNLNQAGNVEINVGELLVQNNGRITAATFGQGNGGNLTINASESIELRGNETEEIAITGLSVNSQNPIATGDGGNLSITTPNLEISDRARITAFSLGQGNGGNINLQISEILRLQNNSLISSTAGSEESGGNGGNINIDAEFLVALPSENSDIVTNAFQGNGGNINIQAQGIFGIEERQAVEGNTTNDIDSSSQLGLSGEVEIDVPDAELDNDNVQLAAQPIETRVIRVCEFDSFQTQNNFFVSGRSGLPETPTAALNADIGWEDWQIGELEFKSPSVSNYISSQAMATSKERSPIQEAQSWIINDRGKVQLIASSTANSTPKLWQRSPNCQP